MDACLVGHGETSLGEMETKAVDINHRFCNSNTLQQLDTCDVMTSMMNVHLHRDTNI